MANLSNINNKFLFTDGDFLKIGNLAPINNISGTESGISITNSNVASITLDNTAASGKRYVMYSSGNGSLVFWDADATSPRLQIDTSGNSTFIGTLQSGNFAIGAAPSSFGSGVPTITLQGTADNSRGGAIVFKEQDGTVTTNIYSTDGSDGYGTVINAAQGSFRVSVGALAANKLEINSSGNATFAGGITSTGLSVNAGTYHKLQVTFPSTYETVLQIGLQAKISNEALSDTVTFANSGTEAVSDFVFTVAGNEKLKIQGNGNATFAGTISAVGASTFTLNDGVFIKAVNGTNNVIATNVWGYGLYEGASKLGEISLVRDGSSSQMYMGTTGANQVLRIGSANKVTALTIDASQNATFAGIIDAGGRVKVSGGGTDQYYFEGARTGVGVTYRLYDNANNIYHDSWTSQVFRLNQNGGSGGNLIIVGGDVGIGTSAPIEKLQVRTDTTTDNSFQGINVMNFGQTATRAGISFKCYDWVQSAIWHGRGTSAAYNGALVLGTNPNTTDLTVSGVTGRMWILNNGDVGIGTDSPTAKLDINGTVRYRGSIYNQLSYQVTGSYSANTWYTFATSATLTENGLYIIVAYIEDFTAGGGNYYTYAASTNFYWVTTSTNRTTAFDFPPMLGTGHATGVIPSIRITQELGAAGALSKLQWQSSYTYTSLQNAGGKILRFDLKRIGA